MAQPGLQRGKLMPSALTLTGWQGPPVGCPPPSSDLVGAHHLSPVWETPKVNGTDSQPRAPPPAVRHPGRALPAPAPPPGTPAPADAACCASSHGSTSFRRSKSATRRRAIARRGHGAALGPRAARAFPALCSPPRPFPPAPASSFLSPPPWYAAFGSAASWPARPGYCLLSAPQSTGAASWTCWAGGKRDRGAGTRLTWARNPQRAPSGRGT